MCHLVIHWIENIRLYYNLNGRINLMAMKEKVNIVIARLQLLFGLRNLL